LEIDLSDFLAPSVERKGNNKYHLHGVLVHSGDVHGGHYFGMIKPEKDSKWYRYDDERVTPVTLNEVLEENFGGEGITQGNNTTNTPQSRASRTLLQWKRFTSAYMLVYLREDCLNELLSPITSTDIPQHVIKQVEEERNELLRRKREKEENHLYMFARLIDIDSFRHHDGVDLANFDPTDEEASKWVQINRVRKDTTLPRLYEEIARRYGEDPRHIRLWHLVNRQNKTIRPDIPIPREGDGSIFFNE
jgi:ubiquitin carboxyl-terminal hydrolase 7